MVRSPAAEEAVVVVVVVVGVVVDTVLAVTVTAINVPEFVLDDPEISMQVTETALANVVSVFVEIRSEL